MIVNFKNFVNTLFRSSPLNFTSQTSNQNSFSSHFLGNTNNSGSYGKNKPVPGGIFGGYTPNGKPIILGSRLFIEA
ncbi:MAG: hypothetical protein V2B14_07145 [bacterium]